MQATLGRGTGVRVAVMGRGSRLLPVTLASCVCWAKHSVWASGNWASVCAVRF